MKPPTPAAAKPDPTRTLEDLKGELSKLASYTQEIGKASQAAGAAGEVVTKVQQLADKAARALQEANEAFAASRTVLMSDIKTQHQASLDQWRKSLNDEQVKLRDKLQAAAADFTEKVKQQSIALTDVVSRQQHLADELASFREALQQATLFADALNDLTQRFDKLQLAVETQNQAQQAILLVLQQNLTSMHSELRIWQWVTLLGVIGAIVSVWLK